MRYIIATTLATLILCGPVAAQDTIGRRDAEHVFVWRDHDAYKRATRAWHDSPTQATVTAIITTMTACVVPPGTAVTIEGKPALALTGVTVADGMFKGCRGVVTDGDVNG